MDLPTSWGTRYDATDEIIREIAGTTLGAVRTAARDDMAALDAIAAFHAAVDERFTDELERKDVFTEEFEDTSAEVAAGLLWETGTRADPRIAWHLARHGLHRAKREVVEPAAVAEKVRAGLLEGGKAAVEEVGTFEVRARPDRKGTNPQTGAVVEHRGFLRVAFKPAEGPKPSFLGDARVVEVPGLGIFTRRGERETIDFEAAEALLRDVRERRAATS